MTADSFVLRRRRLSVAALSSAIIFAVVSGGVTAGQMAVDDTPERYLLVWPFQIAAVVYGIRGFRKPEDPQGRDVGDLFSVVGFSAATVAWIMLGIVQLG